MGTHPTWIPKNLIVPLVQAGLEKEPGLPNVPLITELDVPPQDKPLLQFMARSSTVGRPLATTPGVPPERLAALRTAFNAVMKDKDFLAEMAAKNYDVAPITGEQLQRTADKLVATPRALAERARKILGR
jgi:hypothetical protein